ncbi:carboxymuconolactone decarboxylase family protein [Pseudomonas sp. FP597]|uniref:carboxymuconolactone decarboxylase family protein n=1 Tax=Pseudomonas sp. FP597 TaxID=2954096 RepID=UPI00273606D5|nr:carboxymuconolactone decarboxylase family protein [Pseudomonas sp. FP597]WLI04507.1 carboxymuconolactone decarboxylase family protein [Pseudomonas sp. FP597]
MPEIPYKPLEGFAPVEVLTSILERRGGKLLNIDRMLLHSVPFTQGWGALLGKVRNELSLPEKLLELAICAVCGVLGAEYEMHHHGPFFLKAGGTPAQFNALRDLKNAIDRDSLFSPQERSVLRLALEMTRMGRAPAGLLDQLRDEFGETALVELVGVIASYNMVARFVVTLAVDVEDSVVRI